MKKIFLYFIVSVSAVSCILDKGSGTHRTPDALYQYTSCLLYDWVVNSVSFLDKSLEIDAYLGLSEEEKQKAIHKLGANPEITRFKGLGEISADEFKEFIGENMRLEQVRLTKEDPIHDMLEFYMGKNTYDRQSFIIDNLRIEADYIDELI